MSAVGVLSVLSEYAECVSEYVECVECVSEYAECAECVSLATVNFAPLPLPPWGGPPPTARPSWTRANSN